MEILPEAVVDRSDDPLSLLLVHGLRWLPLWALAVLALSFTRDASAIVAAGGVVAFAVRPSRLTALLGLTGILASLPAPLLFGAPLRESMAYTLNDFYPAADPSWGFVADHYLDGIRDLVRNNLEWLGDHPVEALVLVGGFLFLPFLRRRASAATPFLYGAAVASLVYVLVVPNYTAFRLELVFLPFAALGLASAFMLLDRPLGVLSGRARTRAARARGRAGAA